MKTEIIIAASPAKIWDILMDFEAYPQWNPFLKSIHGKAEAGAKLEVTIQSSDTKAMRFRPTVLAHKAQQEFRWKGKLLVKGIFDGEHYFLLEPISPNQTRLVHGEKFSGLLRRPIMKKIGAQTEAFFKAMNEALAQRAVQA